MEGIVTGRRDHRLADLKLTLGGLLRNIGNLHIRQDPIAHSELRGSERGLCEVEVHIGDGGLVLPHDDCGAFGEKVVVVGPHAHLGVNDNGATVGGGIKVGIDFRRPAGEVLWGLALRQGVGKRYWEGGTSRHTGCSGTAHTFQDSDRTVAVFHTNAEAGGVVVGAHTNLGVVGTVDADGVGVLHTG